MKQYRRVYAQIDLDAVEYNMDEMKKNIAPEAKMIGVVKTDGYGHGATPIALLLEEKEYVWGFATACLDEAVALRKAGIKKPLLVLGCVFPDQYEEMLQYDIRPTVYTEEMAADMSETAVKMGMTARFHIKLDTGMGRLGFLVCEESAAVITSISRLPNVEIEGVFTHFSKADETDKTFTKKQHEQFQWMSEKLANAGLAIPYHHCDNSAGIIDFPEFSHELVRAGISIYGMYPSEEVHKEKVDLKPALSLVSHVAHVKELDAGAAISYGGTYITDKKMKIATVPVGYGDGYPRSLSNKGYVLIHGKKAKILGRICMDQFMVDVTDIEHVSFGCRVILIGKDGPETICVEELSDLSGKFNYEFVCGLSKRIPRIYLRHGEIVDRIDYLA
ncbi:alanine racemase [Hespellia stercorisuis]|uniref:Alanine racemase n=1 Tax=Hespellia stercorisuis DSM 15480 TaxID=1121950 RepID=A0A1M6NBZ1_9FIRM|nr:alanine racemase [Hespellia stercorisuis]SHJ93209.1 alanine racemase [Hespellia stercorisuis DSM 15480]